MNSFNDIQRLLKATYAKYHIPQYGIPFRTSDKGHFDLLLLQYIFLVINLLLIIIDYNLQKKQ